MNQRKYRQADWEEPLIFELSHPGRVGYLYPDLEEEIADSVDDVENLVPKACSETKHQNSPRYRK